jgi:hypothetical protein
MRKNAFVALRFRNRLRYLAIDLCGVHRMFTPRLLAEGDVISEVIRLFRSFGAWDLTTLVA